MLSIWMELPVQSRSANIITPNNSLVSGEEQIVSTKRPINLVRADDRSFPIRRSIDRP